MQSCVSDYSDAYYDLKRLIMVQFPFPLVQMARTFLFFYVFTLPFELVTNMNYVTWSDVLTIFFLTYGYIGIELVSMEMDGKPFISFLFINAFFLRFFPPLNIMVRSFW